MKKAVLLFLALIFVIANFFAQNQKIVQGQSDVKKMNFKPEYKRELPPMLFVDLKFSDQNHNKILEAEEEGMLELKIMNKGKGRAQGLMVEVTDSVKDENFTIKDSKQEIYFIEPGEYKTLKMALIAGFDVKSAMHKLQISVKEHFGYDMDPAYLKFNTYEYKTADIVFSGMEIIDQGEGTAAVKPDKQLQKGELVKAKIVVQNIGQNMAENVNYKLVSKDENIYLENNKGKLGDMKIGEVKEFWVDISPNKRVNCNGELPLYLTVNEEQGFGDLVKYQLPLKLNQTTPELKTKEIVADIDKLIKDIDIITLESSSDKFTANLENKINVDAVTPSATIRKNSVAVVIGIENYDYMVSAPYSDGDAELMKKYFKTRLGIDQVELWKNDEMDGFAFDDIFNPHNGELQKAVIKDKTDVFVYYSGHGIPSKDGENIYLFPPDGKITRLQSQGYNIKDLYDNLDKLGARSVTVFMDACFSGASKASESIKSENLIAAKGINIKPLTGNPWNNNPNFSVFTSSKANQTSLAFDQAGHGLFTYYLCAALQGEADKNKDRKITLGEIEQYIIEHVKTTSKKISSGLQTPEFNGNENMILLEY